MLTESAKRAHKKYIAKLDDIRVRVPKGTKQVWRDHAAKDGKSLSKFVTEAVNAQCERV